MKSTEMRIGQLGCFYSPSRILLYSFCSGWLMTFALKLWTFSTSLVLSKNIGSSPHCPFRILRLGVYACLSVFWKDQLRNIFAFIMNVPMELRNEKTLWNAIGCLTPCPGKMHLSPIMLSKNQCFSSYTFRASFIATVAGNRRLWGI